MAGMLLGLMGINFGIVKAAPEKTLYLKDLEIGSTITLGEYDGTPITWEIIANNHEGYPDNSALLLSKNVLGVDSIKFGTDSNYETSNVRTEVQSIYNGLDERAKKYILKTILPTSIDRLGTLKDIEDYIFLPSFTELGRNTASNNQPYDGVSYGLSTLKADNIASYWTRSADVRNSGNAVQVVRGEQADFANAFVSSGQHGIRPALNISLDTPVYNNGGSFSIYLSQSEGEGDIDDTNVKYSNSGVYAEGIVLNTTGSNSSIGGVIGMTNANLKGIEAVDILSDRDDVGYLLGSSDGSNIKTANAIVLNATSTINKLVGAASNVKIINVLTGLSAENVVAGDGVVTNDAYQADGLNGFGEVLGFEGAEFNNSLAKLNALVGNVWANLGYKLPRLDNSVSIPDISLATRNISYNLNGGTLPENAPTSYIEGIGLAELPTPTKEGHKFVGWYDIDSGYIADGINTENINHNFSQGSSTDDWYLDGLTRGEIESNIKINLTNSALLNITIFETGDRTQYLEITDSSNSTVFKIENNDITATEGYKQEILLEAGDYNLLYKTSNGPFSEPYAKSGLSFSLTEIKTSISNSQTGDVELTAKWGKKSNITYNLNGGTLPDDAPTSYIEGGGLAMLPTPTKTGYKFAGWKTNIKSNSAYEVEFDTNNQAMITEDGTLIFYDKTRSDSSHTINYSPKNDVVLDIELGDNSEGYSSMHIYKDADLIYENVLKGIWTTANDQIVLKAGDYTIETYNRSGPGRTSEDLEEWEKSYVKIDIYDLISNISSTTKGDIALTANWETPLHSGSGIN